MKELNKFLKTPKVYVKGAPLSRSIGNYVIVRKVLIIIN